MANDIEVGTDYQFVNISDSTDDLKTVSGEALTEQSVVIDVRQEVRPLLGGNVETDIDIIEAAIRRGLQNNEYVERVYSVSVETIDKQDGTVTFNAVTERNDFRLTA